MHWTDTIILKSPAEIALMQKAGEIVAAAHDLAARLVRSGITTQELDLAIEDCIVRLGGKPSFKGYLDYPASSCISVNEEVVHGIPGTRVLRDGDIVGVDIGAIWQGYHGDAARTFAVGKVSDAARRLMQVTRQALLAGIEQARVGNRLSDISHAIQTTAEAGGYSVVRSLVGHGIGQHLHEKPQVPNYGPPGRGPRLRAGMVLALEPMVNAGVPEVYTKTDRWTIVTLDGQLSAHYEQTVAITDAGPVVLTGPLHTGLDGESIA